MGGTALPLANFYTYQINAMYPPFQINIRFDCRYIFFVTCLHIYYVK
jgi:hypothetical protein